MTWMKENIHTPLFGYFSNRFTHTRQVVRYIVLALLVLHASTHHNETCPLLYVIVKYTLCVVVADGEQHSERDFTDSVSVE